MLDRVRYGLYPPGSTFKVLVAGAALRSMSTDQTTFACIRLADGRVGNYIRGTSHPVRDDPLDTVPHGTIDLRRALVVSCNAYFAQLAIELGPRPLLEAASLFQIGVARTPTPAGLQPSLGQAGYGQGQVIVSPLKMARVAAAVAADGVVPAINWIRMLTTRAPSSPSRTSFSRRSSSANDRARDSQRERCDAGALRAAVSSKRAGMWWQ